MSILKEKEAILSGWVSLLNINRDRHIKSYDIKCTAFGTLIQYGVT